ncbi:hypothetical protein [Streptomyces sp. NBC_00009]|uniref:hypothetical protein n=1 Tax=Streptomyces sp. NBC_00009 TaxID=2975620 RepID=UPI00324EF2E0
MQERPVRREHAAQVVIGQPGDRPRVVGLGVVRTSRLPQQVVEPVAVRGRLLDQMGVDQLLQQSKGVAPRDAGQRGGAVHADVGPRSPAQQPEHAALGRVELPQRHLEHLRHCQLALAQPFHEGVERPRGPVPQPRCGHPDGQRQVPATAQHLPGITRTSPARGFDEQRRRLLGRQDVQRDRQDAVQLHHPPTAGDHDEAPAGAGEQITHVIGVSGVVQQHDRVPRRQLRPPQRGPLGDPVRNPAGRQPERDQQHTQRLRRPDRLPARSEPVQVHIELTTGEVGRQPMPGVYGQR